ncbi:hypothetical protein G6F24_018499 [Rhizopus arrhizus]|nr:hypothetical protein G6F24_018499 [Rhizopus arrhizus]
MADLNEASGASVIAVEDVPHEKTASYGIVATEAFDGRKGRISEIVEKPKPEDAPSDLAVVGRYRCWWRDPADRCDRAAAED